MTRILTRYQDYKKAEEFIHTTIRKKLASEYRDVCTADELTEMIQWHLEGNNIKQLDITGLNQLQQQLDSFLQQVRIRKTQLRMGVVKALQEHEMQLKKENESMTREIMAARTDGINDDHGDAARPQLPMMDLQII